MSKSDLEAFVAELRVDADICRTEGLSWVPKHIEAAADMLEHVHRWLNEDAASDETEERIPERDLKVLNGLAAAALPKPGENGTQGDDASTAPEKP